MNTPIQAKSQLHSLEQAAEGMGLHINTVFICFKQEGAISTLSGKPQKLNEFTYLGSNISSTESDFNICTEKAWTTVNSLLIIFKSDLSNQIKWNFFSAVTVSILQYGRTNWMLKKCIKNKLDENYISMLPTVLNKSKKETKEQAKTKQKRSCTATYLPSQKPSK